MRLLIFLCFALCACSALRGEKDECTSGVVISIGQNRHHIWVCDDLGNNVFYGEGLEKKEGNGFSGWRVVNIEGFGIIRVKSHFVDISEGDVLIDSMSTKGMLSTVIDKNGVYVGQFVRTFD